MNITNISEDRRRRTPMTNLKDTYQTNKQLVGEADQLWAASQVQMSLWDEL